MIIKGVRYQLTIYSKNVSIKPNHRLTQLSFLVINCGFLKPVPYRRFLPKLAFSIWECKGSRTMCALQHPVIIFFALSPHLQGNPLFS
jgi:hypothetical protein